MTANSEDELMSKFRLAEAVALVPKRICCI